MHGRLRTLEHAREFVTAGKAYLTLVSGKTGARFTYRVSKMEREGQQAIYHVSGLTGPDNDAHYEYLGTVFNERDFKRGRRSRIGFDAPIHRAFAYFWKALYQARAMPAELEVWHDGRCGRCGRHLTVPESVERGLGPDCAAMMGIRGPRSSASAEASGPEGNDSRMGTAPTFGPKATSLQGNQFQLSWAEQQAGITLADLLP